MKIYLISTDYLKNNTIIPQNIEDDILLPNIWKAQEKYISDILGFRLYNKIMTDTQAKTISGDYLFLLNKYIVPCLNEYALYEVLPYISLKLTNKTIARGTAEYLEAADLSDLKYLRNDVRDSAELFGDKMINYLKQHSNLFPEYNSNTGLDENKPNRGNGFFSGIYIPKRGNRCIGESDNTININ